MAATTRGAGPTSDIKSTFYIDTYLDLLGVGVPAARNGQVLFRGQRPA